jgi:hypothetical protein
MAPEAPLEASEVLTVAVDVDDDSRADDSPNTTALPPVTEPVPEDSEAVPPIAPLPADSVTEPAASWVDALAPAAMLISPEAPDWDAPDLMTTSPLLAVAESPVDTAIVPLEP